MKINAEVISIQPGSTFKKTGGGVYKGTLLIYRDMDEDKIHELKLHDNTIKFNKSIASALETAQSGSKVVLTKEKNEQGYWNVTEIKVGNVVPIFNSSEQSSSSSNNSTNNKNTFYNQDADRQLLIVKQSSLKAAVDYGSSINLNYEEILKVAEKFTKWVFSKEELNTSSLVKVSEDEDDLVA